MLPATGSGADVPLLTERDSKTGILLAETIRSAHNWTAGGISTENEQ
ncbi:hypothetical protein [Streptomyces sp. NRRL S-448]